ncbi:DUF4369 domain-containing protein [Dokdonia sp. Hel_I_53]|uniref:DUF4369 domain-containing protein n=1 Tax=Dokdonia sp. Hel_I_53 TaxID=1566287 RepID=UPI001199F7FF|nr:DUF4369 domain-containing protein [Dokdonia sp. Hel_I_53]TVZ51569.1 uncharacterized protein DUF4369 [Dokdonia sp. Hel_I_53]
MKRFLTTSLIAILLISCSKSGNLTVSGTVKGLKKGTLYMQRIQDTALVNIDSLEIDGDPEFEFIIDIKEPEVMYLHLDKIDDSGYDDRIPFFAEAGEINITTSLKNFEGFAAIVGSENQMHWTEFQNMNKKFNDKNLDLIKGSFEAQQQSDQEKILAYDDSLQNLLKRKYLYTGNFAATKKNLEVAPYILLTQIPDANTAYLDTLYGKLDRKIRKSKYGKELKKLIKQRQSE